MLKLPQKIILIRTSEIMPNPYQTRRNFEYKALIRLSQSIKETGLLSPIIVRTAKNGYEVVCGERRVRASIMAGLKEIPAIVVTAGDAECVRLSVNENIHRENLNFVEEGEAYFNFMSYHRIKKENLIKLLSTDIINVNNKLRMLKLSKAVKSKVAEKENPEKYAEALIRIHDEKTQLEILKISEEKKLSFSKTEELINEKAEKLKDKKGNRHTIITDKSNKIQMFKNTINKTVELLKRNGAKVKTEEKDEDDTLTYNIIIDKRKKIL